MSSRRSKVTGSVKHLEYFEGRRGVKGKIVFPAQTSSPNNSRPASPEKGYRASSDRNEPLSMLPDVAEDITFMDSESTPDMGKRVKPIFLLEVRLTVYL